MNIDAADKMPNLAEKPDGVHPKLEKYILRKVRACVCVGAGCSVGVEWVRCVRQQGAWPPASPRRTADCMRTHAPRTNRTNRTPPPPPPCQAFDDPDQPYLPDEVLYRQKEQFSDGVGYDWVDGLKAHAEKVRACGVCGGAVAGGGGGCASWGPGRHVRLATLRCVPPPAHRPLTLPPTPLPTHPPPYQSTHRW